MRKRVFVLTIAVFVFFGLSIIVADPGMFTPDMIKHLQLEKKGLKIPAEKLFNPGGPGIHEAVMQLGGGTATFISANGMIYTNHHVAYGSVARMSTAENNYIRDGFLAKSQAEEVRARGYRASILQLYEEVTEDVLKGIKENLSEEKRAEKVRENITKITEANEKKHPDLDIRVRAFFDGNKYYMYGYFIIRDFRIVYVPPLDIGSYGGEVDNWCWPRHTGDFSFLRAYVSPDGKGVEYAEGNVPYKPRTFLEIGVGGVREGDFVMVLGYPGRTFRYKPSHYLDYQLNSQYAYQVEFRGMTIDIWEQEAAKSEANYVRYAPRIKGLANYYKNFAGKREWAGKVHLFERKAKEEKAMMAYINSNMALKKKYGSILDEFKGLYDNLKKKDPVLYSINWLLNSSYINGAYTTYRYSIEKKKDNDKRADAYKDNRINRTKGRLVQGFNNSILDLEKAYIRTALKKASELPAGQRFKTVDDLMNSASGANIDEKAANLTETLLKGISKPDAGFVNKNWDKEKSVLEKIHNPFFKIAKEIFDKLPEIRDYRNRYTADLPKLFRKFTAVMMQFKESNGEILAPDANSTFRFNYGYVKGYKARDAVYYTPFTTMTGIMEKETGEEPFHLPDRIKEVYKNKDYGRWAANDLGDMPVAFLTSNDITGGNSGSPVLDAYGRVVGTAFDLNWEGITNDYGYTETNSRCVNSDIRYAMLILEKFNAGRVLEELGLK